MNYPIRKIIEYVFIAGLREQLEEKDIMSPELEKLMEDYAEYKPIVETELQGIEKKLNSSGTVDFKSTKFDHLFVDGGNHFYY